jgi:hypothetical protein
MEVDDEERVVKDVINEIIEDAVKEVQEQITADENKAVVIIKDDENSHDEQR